MNNDFAPRFEGLLPRSMEHTLYDTENDKYHHYIPISYGELMGKKLEEHFLVEYDELENLYLSNATPTLPTKFNGEGFLQLDNYFTDFWGYILSPTDIQIFMMLLRWSFGKGFTNIPIKGSKGLMERTGKSYNTIKNCLDVLEENFFILRFQRKTKTVGKGNANNTGMYIKVNDSIPLLNSEQLNKLPPFLREEHDKKINRINHARFDGNDYLLAPTKRMFVKDFVMTKCMPEGRVDRDISFLIKQHGIMPVVETAFVINRDFDDMMKSYLKEVLPKPSYDVFVMNSVFMLENGGELLTIICQDEFTEQGFESGLLKTTLKSMFGKISDYTGVRLADYLVYPFSTYYKALQAKEIF